jgi:large subunit ribosomal protein L24
MNIKKGDIVKILSGDDKGKTGKVIRAFPADGKILVEGINVMKKHERPRSQEGKGQIVDRAMPIFVSKVVKADGSSAAKTSPAPAKKAAKVKK